MSSENDLRQRLMIVFRQEAEERLRVLADGLALLAQNEDAHLPDNEKLESLYREIHSLKGAARAVAFVPVETLCHDWESLFAALKRGQVMWQPWLVGLNDEALRLLQALLQNNAPVTGQVEGICQALELAVQGTMPILPVGQSIAMSAIQASEIQAPEIQASAFNAPEPPIANPATPDDSFPTPEAILTPPINNANPAAQAPESSQASPSRDAQASLPAGENPPHRSSVPIVPKPSRSNPAASLVAPPHTSFNSGPATLRVSASRLDAVAFHLEGLQQTKLDARENALMLREGMHAFVAWRRHLQPLVAASRQLKGTLSQFEMRTQDNIQTLLDFGDWAMDYLGQWEHRLNTFSKAAEKTARNVAASSDALQQEFQTVLILPCSTLTEGMPAMVREIAAAAGKQLNLRVSGESLQVDKRVLDEMRSPLQHLLRNAIDHGIETPSRRIEQGKPEKGVLRVEFLQESGDKFELRVSDDGGGLDTEKLKQKAVSLGLMDADEASLLSEEQAQSLVFTSGVTTSLMITDLSGRGLGLAIVLEKVEALNGEVGVFTEPGKGTTFRLRLPSSFATYRALLVNAGDNLLAIPAHAVEQVLRLSFKQIKSVENRLVLSLQNDRLSLQNEMLPLWRLTDVLGLANSVSTPSPHITVVIMKVWEGRFGLLVDSVVGDQEITVKSLGRQLQRVRNVMGATQLGDGRIVPLLHPQDLYKTACMTATTPMREPSNITEQRKRVLVAEDSVTSRGLLKNILENSGYFVTTSVDGLEAWNALKQGDFDVLVSDIEMPRMDGFQLTTKIRGDRTLASLPVVLVTALQSPEDRARGLDAGASAYIIKSSFDQDSLLDTLKRLL